MIPATFLFPWLPSDDGSRRSQRTPWIAHARGMQYACAFLAAAVFFGG
ncbi:hypothetical protein [Salinarimonas ramus]|nr:hypothetical protein [Salinarimonas ramus]